VYFSILPFLFYLSYCGTIAPTYHRISKTSNKPHNTFTIPQSILDSDMKVPSFFLTALLLAASPQKSQGFLSRDMVATACSVGAVCVAASCIKIISTGDMCLVERLGMYNRAMGPGIHVVFHPFERISFQGTLREQVLDVPPQECFTKDNAPLTADAIVYLRINSMKDACYEIFNVMNAVMNLCLTHVREEVGRLTLEESFSSRGELNRALLLSLNDVCKSWGIEITRVEIQRLQPSPEIMRALESQIAADRAKRATILQSEGEKAKLVNEADGRAAAMVANAEARQKSMILASHGEAERQRMEADGIRLAIETLASAISGEGGSRSEAIKDSLKFLMQKQYLETQGKFASSDGTRVLMFPSQENLPVNIHSLIQ
jgi:regulator of protease activity HflC (stomatin/prohibitin superfamily)